MLNYRSAIRAHVSFETFKWISFKSEFVDPNFSKVFLMCRDLKKVFRPHSLISVHKTYPARTTLNKSFCFRTASLGGSGLILLRKMVFIKILTHEGLFKRQADCLELIMLL